MTAQLPPDFRFPEYGSPVGSWIVRGRIGSGSHGVVFRAVNADRPEAGYYALKLALEPGDARFEREATLLSRVHHPSVPRFEGSGSWTSPHGEVYPYLVMQWVEGMSLYAWAAEQGFTLRQAIGQLAQVARALEATHRHGVHRDVKGANVRVSPEGHAVLLDFGSCWYPGASPLTEGEVPPGTGPYRSPQLLFFEYALGRGAARYYEAQPADDVYALGVTAYRLLAGAYPPRHSDSHGGAAGVVRPVAPPGLRDACPELGTLIVRMLSEDPEARGSARQVAEQLERLREHSRPVLDQPWTEGALLPSTEKARPPAPLWNALREWLPVVALAGSFIVLVLLWGLLTRNGARGEVALAEPQSEPQAADTPDAGSRGLGDEALASVTPAEKFPVSEGPITRRVPDKPLPGQKHPPCNNRAAVVINGGCWRLLPSGAATAPCDVDDYEHQGRCYYPLFNKVERVPTSEQPQ